MKARALPHIPEYAALQLAYAAQLPTQAALYSRGAADADEVAAIYSRLFRELVEDFAMTR